MVLLHYLCRDPIRPGKMPVPKRLALFPTSSPARRGPSVRLFMGISLFLRRSRACFCHTAVQPFFAAGMPAASHRVFYLIFAQIANIFCRRSFSLYEHSFGIFPCAAGPLSQGPFRAVCFPAFLCETGILSKSTRLCMDYADHLEYSSSVPIFRRLFYVRFRIRAENFRR